MTSQQYTVFIVLLLLVLITFVIYQLTKPFCQVIKRSERFKVTSERDQVYLIQKLQDVYVRRMTVTLVCADTEKTVDLSSLKTVGLVDVTVTLNNKSRSFKMAVGQSYVIDEFTDGLQLDVQDVTISGNADAVYKVALFTIEIL